MPEKYDIKVNEKEKVLNVAVRGSFSNEEVENFVNDYKKEVKKITPSTYNLVVDCTTMEILQQEMIPSLENSYKMYKESGFNKVIFHIKKNPVLKMQLNRLAKNTGLTNGEVEEV